MTSTATMEAQGPPPFTADITITSNPEGFEICLGETLSLNAAYTANRDVTRKEWSVNGALQGVETIPDGEKLAGADTLDFTPTDLGLYLMSFRIWHHSQTTRNYQESVLVSVVSCDDCPAAPAIANAYLRSIGFTDREVVHPLINAVADAMNDGLFGDDKCDPLYEALVIDYVESLLP
jgi:hypothetical protein